MKTYLTIASFLVLAGTSARAQQMSSPLPVTPSPQALEKLELTCRNKAKEAAAQAYRGCMVESKSSQIEQIRKEYQEKLSQMRAEYEQQLGRVSGKNKADKTVQKPTVIKTENGPTVEVTTGESSSPEVWTGDFTKSEKALPSGKTVGKAGKALLFEDKNEIPEPIPVEKLGSSGPGEN